MLTQLCWLRVAGPRTHARTPWWRYLNKRLELPPQTPRLHVTAKHGPGPVTHVTSYRGWISCLRTFCVFTIAVPTGHWDTETLTRPEKLRLFLSDTNRPTRSVSTQVREPISCSGASQRRHRPGCTANDSKIKSTCSVRLLLLEEILKTPPPPPPHLVKFYFTTRHHYIQKLTSDHLQNESLYLSDINQQIDE